MTKGAEIPYRRSHFAQGTGSLIFDRQREDRQREARKAEEPMRVWTNGHFAEA